MAKHKHVKWEEIPYTKKQTQIVEDPDSFYDQTPLWSFSQCDFYHNKWGIKENSSNLAKIILRLKAWEGQKWGEILSDLSGRSHNTKNHSIPTYKIVKEAQCRLHEIGLDDFDELYSLSVNNLIRLWGIILGRVFYLIWIDPNHEIYKCQSR